MRIGIIGLLHESNTFVPDTTTLDGFQQDTLLTGDAMRDRFFDSHHELGGFFRTLDQAATTDNIETVPIFAARALPSGTIDAATFDQLLARLSSELDKCSDLDGLLVAPHGATVSQRYLDADGHWLAWLRARCGPQMPIVGTLDLHANLSPTMVTSCDAFVAYRTNPHLDQEQRGSEAAEILLRTVRGEVRPTMAACFPAFAMGIETQDTAAPACHDLFDLAQRQRRSGKVLSNSLLLGFPYADVVEMGSSALVVTDDDPGLAQQFADDLGNAMWDRREQFIGRLLKIEEAMKQCGSLTGSVCLLDMGDNVGGGSAADGTFLADALHRHRVESSFVCLYDPAAVQVACDTGVGNQLPCAVGGHTDDLHGRPLQVDLTIKSLHDGAFRETKVRHGGISEFDQGRTAIVETSFGMTLMLTSQRMVPFSLEQLRSCGLRPESFHVLVAKGVHAPVAAYEEVCDHLLRVNTPGSTCADMTKLEFQRRRKPMFPFERPCDDRASLNSSNPWNPET